jgi:hypothetical protein
MMYLVVADPRVGRVTRLSILASEAIRTFAPTTTVSRADRLGTITTEQDRVER